MKNVEISPSFNKGQTVFSVMTGEKLTVVKANAAKGKESVQTYTVAPKTGIPYRATEGELMTFSPCAPKVRKPRFQYDNESDDRSDRDDRRDRRDRDERQNFDD